MAKQRALMVAVVLAAGFSGARAQGQGVERPAPEAAQTTTGTTLPAAPARVSLTSVVSAPQPVSIVARPGDPRLFVIEKEGRVRAVVGTTLTDPPVVDLRGRISTQNEQGLLGLAFPPNRSDVLYLDYTDPNGAVVVSEVPFDGTVADLARERVLLRIPKKLNEHNAGTLLFDSNGLLYIAIGDGGGSGDPDNNAQRLDSLLGKVLRIDPTPSAKLPYSIPAANPLSAVAPSRSGAVSRRRGEILHFGLRNPWGISRDPLTGDLLIPDVGQNLWEEVNLAPAATPGLNFGWRQREGSKPFRGSRPKGAVDPVYDWPHKDGRCAVAGAVRYRGTAIPALAGWVIAADVCGGRLIGLRQDVNAWKAFDLGVRVGYITSLGTDNAGEIYVTTLGGPILRLGPA